MKDRIRVCFVAFLLLVSAVPAYGQEAKKEYAQEYHHAFKGRTEKSPGWVDLRRFPHMTIAQGAAVGGGSHIYANVSCEAPKAAFEDGWPPEIRYQDLSRIKAQGDGAPQRRKPPSVEL